MKSSLIFVCLLIAVGLELVRAQPEVEEVEEANLGMMPERARRCRYDRNCRAGEQCRNGYCMRMFPRNCRFDDQCSRLGNFYCSSSTLTCVAKRPRNSQCTRNSQCISNRCNLRLRRCG